MISLLYLINVIHFPIVYYVTATIVTLAVNFGRSVITKKFRFLNSFLDFGKTYKKDKNPFLFYFMVPKRWFGHFYIFSSIFGSICFSALLSFVVLGAEIPKTFHSVFLLIVSEEMRLTYDSVSNFRSLLSLFLLMVQCYRRLHECYRVSIFGAESYMNIIHYALGFSHYLFAFSVLLDNSDALTTGHRSLQFNSMDILVACFSSATFFAAWFLQRDSMVRLADLRRTNNGSVSGYFLPSGGGFDYVLCPHMTAEIGMYISILALQCHTHWLLVIFFVIANQYTIAQANLKWYRHTFGTRKVTLNALIPSIW